MLAGAPGTTVTTTCPVRSPEVAEIVAVPLRNPVTRPELTEATEASELDHVTSDAGELPPEPSLILAVACTEVPDAMEVVESVITRDELGSDVERRLPRTRRGRARRLQGFLKRIALDETSCRGTRPPPL